MLSRTSIRNATKVISRPTMFSTTTVARQGKDQKLGKVSTPVMDVDGKQPDNISNSNAKPNDLNLEGQSPLDSKSNEDLKKQSENAESNKTKNEGVYKRDGQ